MVNVGLPWILWDMVPLDEHAQVFTDILPWELLYHITLRQLKKTQMDGWVSVVLFLMILMFKGNFHLKACFSVYVMGFTPRISDRTFLTGIIYGKFMFWH